MATKERRLSPFHQVLENFAKSKVGGWYYLNIAPPIDRVLMKASGGRLNANFGFPVLVVHNKGAKSGIVRETPLVYAMDGDNVIIVASKAGSPKNPGWYYNLKAHPDVECNRKGKMESRRAREAAVGAEYDRLWEVVNYTYAGYTTYQGRAGDRKIPLMVLEPR
jgi:deazaflavin-dependent oxidoreductase (nitroreductase family)